MGLARPIQWAITFVVLNEEIHTHKNLKKDLCYVQRLFRTTNTNPSVLYSIEENLSSYKKPSQVFIRKLEYTEPYVRLQRKILIISHFQQEITKLLFFKLNMTVSSILEGCVKENIQLSRNSYKAKYIFGPNLWLYTPSFVYLSPKYLLSAYQRVQKNECFLIFSETAG